MTKYLIFIHIAKNAGNTVIDIIKNSFKTVKYNPKKAEHIDTLDFEAFILTPWCIKHFKENNDYIWNNSIKFATKRNIYEKFISGIEYLPIIYLQQGKQHTKIIRNKYLESKFNKDNLLESIFNNLPEMKYNRQKENPKYGNWPKNITYEEIREQSAYQHLLALQTEYIFENDKLILDKLIDIKDLKEELKNIFSLFNKQIKEITHKNKNNNKKKIVLKEKHIEFINSHFKKDFILLNYKMM